MTIQQALGSYLKTVSAITTLVSTRIYWQQGPEATATTTPVSWIIFNVDDTTDINTLTSVGNFAESRITITCFSRTSIESAQSIADATRTALKSYRGLMPPSTGLNILTTTIGPRRDLEDPQPGIFGVPVEVTFFYPVS